MHPALEMLQRVTALLREEEEAIAAEDLDKAEELSFQRGEMLDQAWSVRQGCDEDALRAALSTIQTANKSLTLKAQVLQGKFQRQQQAGRKQTRYFSTERHLHSEMRKSIYCDAKT